MYCIFSRGKRMGRLCTILLALRRFEFQVPGLRGGLMLQAAQCVLSLVFGRSRLIFFSVKTAKTIASIRDFGIVDK